MNTINLIPSQGNSHRLNGAGFQSELRQEGGGKRRNARHQIGLTEILDPRQIQRHDPDRLRWRTRIGPYLAL
jgi:hypothetical protein